MTGRKSGRRRRPGGCPWSGRWVAGCRQRPTGASPSTAMPWLDRGGESQKSRAHAGARRRRRFSRTTTDERRASTYRQSTTRVENPRLALACCTSSSFKSSPCEPQPSRTAALSSAHRRPLSQANPPHFAATPAAQPAQCATGRSRPTSLRAANAVDASSASLLACSCLRLRLRLRSLTQRRFACVSKHCCSCCCLSVPQAGGTCGV